MPNTSVFTTTMTRYLKARIPFIAVRTPERARALAILRDIARNMGVSVYVHTLSQGLKDISTNRIVNDDRSLAGALEYAGSQMVTRETLTFVFTEVQDLSDDTPPARQLYDLALLASEQAGTLIVLTTNPVWGLLQRLGVSIVLDPPNEDEMLGVLSDIIEPHRRSVRVEWSDGEFRQAASILAGLTRMEAENVIATLLATGAVRKDDLAELSHAKDHLFADISGLERVVLQRDVIGVGGLAGLRSWLDRERHLLTADLRDRHLRPPRGMLLVGVPGCGKSLSAKFVASTWKLPLYRLDLATIHGMYLGQSEGRLKEALATADHVAPCVLWIDEIEKGLAGSGSSSDGGAASRVVGHFLFWLQEARARVFVVATANEVMSLPPELLRRGRFDEIFFVDLPSPDERADIIRLYVHRNLRTTIPESLLEQLVDLSDGFAGSDLEAGVREVAKEAVLYGDDRITPEIYLSHFANIVPLSKTSPERIEQIRLWGKERAVPASGNPVPSAAPARRSGRTVLV